MKQYIWDTGALTLFYADHSEAKKIMSEIENGKANGYIPRIIIAEYYYKTWQTFGKKIAQYRVVLLRNSKNLEIQLDERDIFTIGRFKIDHPLLSFVDCVVLTLGIQNFAVVLTTDEGLLEVKKAKIKKFNY